MRGERGAAASRHSRILLHGKHLRARFDPANLSVPGERNRGQYQYGMDVQGKWRDPKVKVQYAGNYPLPAS